MKKSCYGILSILLSWLLLLLPIHLTAAYAENNSVIGYGPLENELGFPLIISVDNSNRIWVLDALKSSICVFSENFSIVNSFSLPISQPSPIHQLDFQANTDNCWLLINEYLYKISIEGVLLTEINLKAFPTIGMRSIHQFASVSDTLFLFTDNLTYEAFLMDISKNDQPPVILMENNLPLLVKDIQSFQGYFFILCLDDFNSSENESSFYQFNTRGEILRKGSLVNSRLPSSIGFSMNSSGDCYLYDAEFKFEVYTSQFSLLYSSLSALPESPQYQPHLAGFLQHKALLIHPYKGIFLYDGHDNTLRIPVANSENALLMPSSVCGNHQQVVTYDSITNKLHYYYYELWKSAFKLDFPKNDSYFQSNIQLFQSSTSDVFVVYQDVFLRILKVNPTNWVSSEIQIPSYIPPISTVFIRSEDNRVFIYSWIDSILYSFTAQSDDVVKTQIPKIENPYLLNDCRICVDKSGFVFLLVPSVHKVYVFDTSGALVHYFTLLEETFFGYTDIKLFQNLIVVCNTSKCNVGFYTTKGEYINSYGTKGTILYPKHFSAYAENRESLNYPLSLNTFDQKLWIADAGNSRIIVFQGKVNTEIIKIELQIGSRSAYVNQNRIELEAPPFTENGRTLVPLRFIGEAFGAKIDWEAETKKVTYSLGSTKIEVIIGSVIAVVNGEKKNLDVPPKLVNGRTFVPLRFISESFGASVIWEAETKKIYIEFSKPS
ncbi:hypothetical protein LLG10_07325 [bacterium]|nr:hypothetical protein [bacterium]